MSNDFEENLTVDEIKRRLRSGYSFHPTQPGLMEAARQLIRPLVEQMEGREIIYECRFPKLMRVDYLETDDERFRAVATPLKGPDCRIPTYTDYISIEKALNKTEYTNEELRAALNALPPNTEPLDFGGGWNWHRMHGLAICVNMLTDCFYTDQAVVAEVKAALANAAFNEVSSILRRACGDE